MQQVAIDKLHNWKVLPLTNGYRVPSSIDCVCGFCGYWNSLVTSNYLVHDETKSVSMKGKCKRCNKDSIVWILNDREVAGENNEECWVYPKIETREYKFTEIDFPNQRIFLDYQEAIETFNEGRPKSSINSCLLIIEEIGKANFPNAEKIDRASNFFNRRTVEYNKLPEEFQKLVAPLNLLRKALKIGGNMATYFDIEGQPDKKLASKIIDLTEFLIQYFYTLSNETAKMNEIIANLVPNDVEN